MAIRLTKGENVSLGQLTGEKKFKIGLSWDVKAGQNHDLDAIALLLNDRVQNGGKCINESFCAAYFNGTDPGRSDFDKVTFRLPDGNFGFQSIDGAVKLMGDARNGEKSGWDEEINIDLEKLDPRVKSILILVNIYSDNPAVNFGQVKNAVAEVCVGNSDIPEIVTEMSEDNSSAKCLRFVEIYKRTKPDGTVDFKMASLLDGSMNDLESELRVFGLPVE